MPHIINKKDKIPALPNRAKHRNVKTYPIHFKIPNDFGLNTFLPICMPIRNGMAKRMRIMACIALFLKLIQIKTH